MFSCVCPAYDYDEPRVYNKKTVVARKEHRCYECHDVIAVGDKHEHVRALYDDSAGWSSFRTCLVCVAIREDFRGKGCGFLHGDLWQSLKDTYEGEYDEETDTYDEDVDWLR